MFARVSRGASSSPLQAPSSGSVSNAAGGRAMSRSRSPPRRRPPTPPPPHDQAEAADTFEEFFDTWLAEQDVYLHELIAAADRFREHPECLRGLLGRVTAHYEHYYRAKSAWVQQDVLAMLSPSWMSTLEDALLWIGGWRPSMAFHVIYSKSGLQLETRLHDLVQGIPTADLADLSGEQLKLMDELQRRTIREEREITEEMAKVQESAADSSMVDLSHTVTQMMRSGNRGGGGGGSPNGGPSVNERVDSTLVAKEKLMEELLHGADDLRLRTLRAIVDEVLTPIQAVHFFIAVAELHLRVHDWGKRRDDDAVDASQPST